MIKALWECQGGAIRNPFVERMQAGKETISGLLPMPESVRPPHRPLLHHPGADSRRTRAGGRRPDFLWSQGGELNRITTVKEAIRGVRGLENSGKSRSLYCKRERKHSHENLENHSRPYRRRPCYRWDCRHSLGMRQEVSCPGKRAGNSPGFRKRRSQNRRPYPNGIARRQSGRFLACRAGWWLCGGVTNVLQSMVLREVSMIGGWERPGSWASRPFTLRLPRLFTNSSQQITGSR